VPSSYTQNLGLEKPATGEQAGSWGNTANNDYDFLDASTDGNVTILLSSSAYTLATQQGAASDARKKVIIWTGTLTQDATVSISPKTAQKLYFMTNSTAGGFKINFQQGSGAVFTLNNGCSAIITCDGTGNGAGVTGANWNPQFGSVVVTSQLTVQGGASIAGSVSFGSPITFTQNATFTTISAANVSITRAGGAAWDIYYRDATGYLAPLNIGASGQVLQVTGSGTLAWTTRALSIGDTITGSAVRCVYYCNASGQLSQDAQIQINAGVGLGIGLNPQKSLHVGGSRYPEIWLDTANTAAQSPQVIYATNSLMRWQVRSQDQETGGNSGSNYAVINYNDSGAFISYVMFCTRSTGNVTIGAQGDFSAKLAVLGSSANPTIMARAGTGQYIQTWQNSSGQVVASIDNAGHLFLAAGTYLALNQYGCLELWPTVAGHPYGTIHIGQEQGALRANGLRSAIAMETASATTDSVPLGLMRFYFRNNAFVIQFAGTDTRQWFAYLPLVPGENPTASWKITAAVV